MVGDLCKGIAGGLDELFRRKARGVQKLARNWRQLPGWYLQYLYGWKPLADDLENAVDQLSKDLFFNDSLHVILKGRWKGSKDVDFSHAVDTYVPGYVVKSRVRLTQVNTCSFRYDIPTDRLPTVEPLGFFGTLWEGSPYSFVADWVAPIGDWLTALDANALWPYFIEGSVSETIRGRPVRTWAEAVGGWHMSGEVTGTVSFPQLFSFRRVLRGPNTLTARIPFKNPLSLSHAAQGLSLLTQALQRHW